MKLGVLGGGQLALYLGQAAKKLEIPISFLVKSEQEPIVTFGFEHKFDTNSSDLLEFCQENDVILFESELYPTEKLENLNLDSNKFIPSLKTMKTLGNKLSQKQLFLDLDLKTAKHIQVESSDWDPENKNWVLKTALGGYDGKGNFFVKENKFQESRNRFIKTALDKNINVYAEEWIPFRKELALVASRDQFGNLVFYPLVETVQKQGVCSTAFGPIKDDRWEICKDMLKKVAEQLNYVGTLAIEFFETSEGDILINEMAPRVHNSGHISQESSISQFENHILAVSGKKVKESETENFYKMINLLGPEIYSGPSFVPHLSEGNLYWYEKKESRPMRKLGHVNFTADTLAKLSSKEQKLLEEISLWENQKSNLPENL